MASRRLRCVVLAWGGLSLASVAQGDTSPLANNAFNPAISVILNAKYAPLTDTSGRIPGFPLGSEVTPLNQGLFLDETELTFSANIDDRYFGVVNAALHSHDGETTLELEEAYIDTVGLGLGVTIRAGRFLSNIGYLNSKHPHAWDFADAPLPYQALLGTQFSDDGVQLNWVAPTVVYFGLGGEAFRGDSYPASGAANDGVGAYTAFARMGGDVGVSHSWRVGVSGLWANAVDRVAGDGHSLGSGGTGLSTFSGDANVGIVDVVWKWAPGGNPTQRAFTLQGEYLFRREDGVVSVDGGAATSRFDGDQNGWYLQGVFQFARGWRIGARYDRLGSDNIGSDAAVLEEAGFDDQGHAPQRYSLMLDRWRSEFSTLRLQFNRDQSGPGTDHQVIFQYVMSLGAHGAHRY